MNIVCLMPTFGRPRHLLENAIECFRRQRHEDKALIILDDEEYFTAWPDYAERIFYSLRDITPLAKKYNDGVATAQHLTEWIGKPDAYAVWDDDDVYGPDYLSFHAAALERTGRLWSHPRLVYSTYSGQPQTEDAKGRFHGALCVRAEVAQWPETQAATFDQQMLARLAELGPNASPEFSEWKWGADGQSWDMYEGPYVFRWSDTSASHVQHFMTAEHGDDWQAAYQAAARAARRPEIDRPDEPLIPRLDASAAELWSLLWPGN